MRQSLRVDLQFLAGVDVGGRGPGLKAFAHRQARAAVNPFVEFPFLTFSQVVELGEFQQFAAGNFVEAKTVKETHPHAADERPDVRRGSGREGSEDSPCSTSASLDHRLAPEDKG